MKKHMALVIASLLLTSGVTQAARRPMPTAVTPEGQTLVIIGEAEDRSDALKRGDQWGFSGRAPFRALHEIEKGRVSGSLMLEAGLDLNGSNSEFNWSAGQWLQFTLAGGEEVRATRIFVSGPKNDMNVYALGRQLVRMSRDQLHGNDRPGVKFFPTLLYVALPASVQRNGRNYTIGMSDITSVRIVHISPDSLTAVAERR